jgi:tetratricopeptide (TPR) repeat protein
VAILYEISTPGSSYTRYSSIPNKTMGVALLVETVGVDRNENETLVIDCQYVGAVRQTPGVSKGQTDEDTHRLIGHCHIRIGYANGRPRVPARDIVRKFPLIHTYLVLIYNLSDESSDQGDGAYTGQQEHKPWYLKPGIRDYRRPNVTETVRAQQEYVLESTETQAAHFLLALKKSDYFSTQYLLIRNGFYVPATMKRDLEGLLGLDAFMSIRMLGQIYLDNNKLDEAEKMYQVAVDGLGKTHGLEDTRTLTAMSLLGSVYVKWPKLDKAADIYKRLLKEYSKKQAAVYGPSRLTTIAELSLVFADQHKPDEAARTYKLALERFGMLPSQVHTFAYNTDDRWGLLYGKKEKQDKAAEAIYVRALEFLEKELDKETKLTLITAHNLAATYISQKNLGEAEEMMNRVVRGFEKKIGPRTCIDIACVLRPG